LPTQAHNRRDTLAASPRHADTGLSAGPALAVQGRSELCAPVIFSRPQHVGGLATAALGLAFIWRDVLHARPGERFDLWFGILVAQLMVTLCFPAVTGAVFAWRHTPERGWPLQAAPGLIVLALVGPRSPAPLLLLAALLAFLDARSSGRQTPLTLRTP
jgi:hypothetical protein